MKNLGPTVKNFISQCTGDAIVWAIDIAFPLNRAIEADNYKKIEAVAKKINVDDFTGYLCTAAEHGNPQSLKILLSVFENRFPKEFSSYRPNSVLLSAVSKSHTQCALLVLDKCQADHKYEAFETAIENNTQDFLTAFVNQIPASSNRWPEVFNRLENLKNDELTVLALQRCKIENIYMHLEDQTRQYIDSVVAKQQKQAIVNQLQVSKETNTFKRKL